MARSAALEKNHVETIYWQLMVKILVSDSRPVDFSS